MDGTVVLYLMIFLVTSFLASQCQSLEKDGRIKVRRIFLYTSFIIHWIFLVFTNIGVDYNNYIRIIKNVSLENLFSESEVVFSGLCLALKNLFESPDVVVFFLKTITLVLFYIAFMEIAQEANIGLCMIAFNAFVYLQGYFILGMQIAIACLLLSTIYLKQDREKKALLLLILACGLHSSSILFIPLYVMYFVINLRKKKMSISFVVLISVSYVLAYLFIGLIMNWGLDHIPQLAQYRIYNMVSDYKGIGLVQILYFIPLLYFVYLINNNSNSVNLKNLSIVFVFTAFLFAMIGYKIEVFSRINKSFLMIYAYLIPNFFFERKYNNQQSVKNGAVRFIFNYRSDLFFWMVYIIIRGIDVFVDMGLKSSTSLLNPYIWFNPFS